MKKKTKFQDFVKKFKKWWAIPRYRAIIKLSLYAFMFLILIIIANLYSDNNSLNSNENDNKKTLAEIINSKDYENVDIEYTINSLNNVYTIEGKLNNNILNGYIEYNGVIKKIILKENNIYNISNNNEIIDEELNNVFIKELLIPKNILKMINNETAYIEKLENMSNYTYNITYNNTNYEIKLTIDSINLTTINITNENIDYNLEFIFDKSE